MLEALNSLSRVFSLVFFLCFLGSLNKFFTIYSKLQFSSDVVGLDFLLQMIFPFASVERSEIAASLKFVRNRKF